MKNFKKLLATVLSLSVLLSSTYLIQTFGYGESVYDTYYSTTISFKEIDQFFDENTPSESWREEYNKCEQKYDKLEKIYYDKMLKTATLYFSPILALPLAGFVFGHFIPNFLNRNSSNEKIQKSNAQKNTNSENKKRSWKKIGTLIGGLMSGLYCCLFKPVSKLLKLDDMRKKNFLKK